MLREKHPAWKGGRLIDSDGYIRIWKPKHQWPRKGYILEHVMVMENVIGRKIRIDECVHHKDHNRQNNVIGNLELLLRSDHSRKHRALDKHNLVKGYHGRFVSNKNVDIPRS